MIFWLAFATLVYEITVSRVFAYLLPYHFTPLAISLAMLGLGLGAGVRLVWADGKQGGSGALGALAAAFLLFGAGLFVHWGFWFLVFYALPPFLLLGLLLSRLYNEAAQPHRAYALDMTGGCAACLVALPLFNALGPVGLTLLLACAFAAASVAVAGRPRPAGLLIAALSAAAAGAWFFGVLPDPAARPRFGALKPMHEAMRSEGGRIADFAWGAAGRADLYEHPSFANIKWVYNDATNSSYLLRQADTRSRQDFLRDLVLNLPLSIGERRRVAVIGSGGGVEVQLARLAGVSAVDAVEVNPAVVELVRRWAGFTGPLYDAPGVNVHLEEGRRFLSSSRLRYDLIQMSLAFTGTALSGSLSLVEGNLYTVEAYRLYLRRLSPGGALAIIDDSQQRTVRCVLTALVAMEQNGLPFAQGLQRIAVIGNPGIDGTGYAYLTLVSNEPFLTRHSARERLMRLCRKRGFTPLWVPELSAMEPYAALAREGRELFLSRQQVDLRPRTDDHPYFFYFGKGWRSHWRALQPLAWLCGGALLLAAALSAAISRRLAAPAVRPAALAALCGLSFMLIESALLQKLSLTTRSPAQTLSLLLFSLLLWCSLGSRWSASLRSRGQLTLWAAFAAAAAASGLCALLLSSVYAMEGVPSEAARRILVFLLLAPVGLSLGAPFPLLLDAQARHPDANGLLWGINGLAAVSGACLAIAVSFLWGINACFFAGAAGYAAAALLSALPPMKA